MKFDVTRSGIPATSLTEALSKAIQKLSYLEEKKINAIAATALEDFLDRVGNTMRKSHGRAWPGGTGVNSLSRRSGRGLSSLTNGKVVREARSIAAIIRLPRYLAHQEFGYLSTAKGRFLTIPLPAALNADGTPKKRSARQWLNTFVVKGTKGQLTICTRRGRATIPLYALKPSVRIAPRLGLRRAMKTEMKMFKSQLGQRITKLLRDVD